MCVKKIKGQKSGMLFIIENYIHTIDKKIANVENGAAEHVGVRFSIH